MSEPTLEIACTIRDLEHAFRYVGASRADALKHVADARRAADNLRTWPDAKTDCDRDWYEISCEPGAFRICAMQGGLSGPEASHLAQLLSEAAADLEQWPTSKSATG